MKAWASDGAWKSAKAIHTAYIKHLEEVHNRPCVYSHEGNGKLKGPFAFTLTASPSDGLTKEDMIEAVKKIMSQQSCKVTKYAWYLEYGKPETQEHPHIHGIYETESGGVIEKKHWKRAWKIWDPKQKLGAGFRGGYHRPVRSNENYNDYIAKDGGENARFNC